MLIMILSDDLFSPRLWLKWPYFLVPKASWPWAAAPGCWTAANIKTYFDKGIADVLYKPSTMCKASTTEGMPKIKTDF